MRRIRWCRPQESLLTNPCQVGSGVDFDEIGIITRPLLSAYTLTDKSNLFSLWTAALFQQAQDGKENGKVSKEGYSGFVGFIYGPIKNGAPQN